MQPASDIVEPIIQTVGKAYRCPIVAPLPLAS
jgi:hypothetical protein